MITNWFTSGNKNKRLDISLLILRISTGGFMLYSHGYSKLLKLLAGAPYQFANPLGLGTGPTLSLAVFSEFICAGFIVLGLLTRWATIPLIFTMLVAAFIIHGADPFADKEFSLLYLFPLIVIFLMGGGKYSLDQLFNKK